MTLEELIEAQLAGVGGEIPPTVREEFRPALQAHEALLFAVGETIGWQLEPDRRPPELPGDYELVSELGRGGMGVVYLALQKSLGRQVAVKVLGSGAATHAPLVQRFLEEARHMAQLRHPNIVAVHEVGRAEQEPYFTMDFVPGESLGQRLATGPLTVSQAVVLLKQVTAAIQHAHEQGIVHRDLKPGNILVDRTGRAFVTDFGLARDVTGGSDLTRTGEILGTPAYMAPEQARGESDLIGEATDVYALGAILYEMLTGRPPHGQEVLAVLFARLLHDAPVPPRRLNGRVPRDLETICLKCLEKTPSHRYPTARALPEDLRRFEAGEPIQARRPSLAARTGRLMMRQWRVVATAALTALLVGVLAVFLLDRSVADLRAWGQERERTGDHAGAIEIYCRAWRKARGAEKESVKEDLLRCARATDDARAAVTAAREVLREDPYASFGAHDLVVAQAVLAELRARYPGRGIGHMPSEAKEPLQLAEKRLRLVLKGETLTAAEREQAEEALSAVNHALNPGKEPPPEREPAESTIPLPGGTRAELERLATDTEQPQWERGKALLSLALQAEERGDTGRAKVLAAEAFDRLRRAYPIFRGTAKSIVISSTRGKRIGTEAPEARLLREADTIARRLDPTWKSPLRSKIRLRLVGVKLHPRVTLDANVVLTDANDGPRDRRFHPFCRVPFDGAVAEIDVADGTYSLTVTEQGASHSGEEAGRFTRLLEWDLDRLPKMVRLQGEVLEVKIPLRQLREVTLNGPAAGSTLDPTSDFLQWKAVEGAASYRVKLGVQKDRAGVRSVEALPEVSTPTTRVCLGALNDAAAERRAGRLEPGTTLLWAVEAFDRMGRRIAVSLESARPVLLTRGVK